MQKEEFEKELEKIYESEIEPKLQYLEQYRLSCNRKGTKIIFGTFAIVLICILLYKCFGEPLSFLPLILFPILIIYGIKLNTSYQQNIIRTLIKPVLEKTGITISRFNIIPTKDYGNCSTHIQGFCKDRYIDIQNNSYGTSIEITISKSIISNEYIQEKTNYAKSLFPNSEFNIEAGEPDAGLQSLFIYTKDCLIDESICMCNANKSFNKNKINKLFRNLATVLYLVDYLIK